jgi:hypothetical protein
MQKILARHEMVVSKRIRPLSQTQAARKVKPKFSHSIVDGRGISRMEKALGLGLVAEIRLVKTQI